MRREPVRRGEVPWWVPLVMLFCATAMALVLTAAGWLAGRGLEIPEVACRWDPSQGAYIASMEVANREDLYKVASFRVQARLKPPAGQRWPHRLVKAQYESISQQFALSLAPRETVRHQAGFPVPGVEGFQCAAKAWIGQQEKFSEPPNPAILDAMQRRLQSSLSTADKDPRDA